MNLQWRPDLASALARSQQERPRGKPGEVLTVPLSQQIKDQQRYETHKHCPALSISKPSSASLTIEFYLYPPNITCSPQVLPQMSQLTSFCQSARVHEEARSCSTPPEVFCCVSLYGVLTTAAQLCNVRQINTCVLLAKHPSSPVLALTEQPLSLLCLH